MKPPVVFLHGLARTHRSLRKLRNRVASEGYETWARTYPAKEMPIAELADRLAGWIRKDLGDRPVLGVTHSLGGVMARHLASRISLERVVMLAPPNAGSMAAKAMLQSRLLRKYFGPVLHEVAHPDGWPTPPTPTAVVAGTSGPSIASPPSWLIGWQRVLPKDEPNDGVLAVSETRLPELTDFATVEATHTWIMDHPRAVELVVDYLNTGRFGDGQVG